MEKELNAGKLYRHYKGNIYQIVTVALHTETNEEMVIYQALYGEYKVFARPLKMFFENVHDAEGVLVPRFAEYVPGNTRASEENVMAVCSETETVEAVDAIETVQAEVVAEVATEDICEGVNPMLIKFLDAGSIEEKLEILHDMRKTIDDKTISDIGVTMDLVIEEGPLEDRIAHLEYYLKTRARFEASRLR